MKVTPNKIVNFLFVLRVQILEFMQSGKFDDIQSIRCYDVRSSHQKIFGF